MIKNNKIWIIVFTLLAFGLFFFLRLSKLNNIPVFVDEAIYVRWSQVMKNEPNLRFIPQTDGKQPLFMWSTIPFFKISDDPLLAGRLVSVTTGFGTLLGVGFLAYLIFADLLVVSLSMLVFAILPYSVFFDRMALADSMLGMFGIWSLALSILFAKTRKLDHAMLLGFAIGGGLLTKSPAIMFYIWLALSLLFFFRPKGSKLKTLGNLSLGLLAIVIISQAMYGILRLGPAFEMIGARNQDYLFTWREVLGHPLIILGLLPKKTRSLSLFLIFVSLLPLVAQAAIAKVYTSRYALFAVLPLIPVIGFGFHWLVTRKGILIKLSTLILLLVPLIFSLLCVFAPTKALLSYDMHTGYLEEWTAGWGQKEVANYLIDLESKGEKIVVFTEGFFGTLPDGLQIYTNGHPNITVVGSNPYVGAVPEGLVNTSPDNARFLVINKSRNHLSAGSLDTLKLIKEFPKPARLDGTQEVLQFYRYQLNSL
ncbi:MAG: PMT family glycosyltransferase, 4-amino-4-deoxy-L-arabinose transferase [candidate division WWE3 bacterium GW2011_GWB1_42_6]|uniref:PMT family glycosyltransferase, 4-amino-4-deoxy-L-arabinose transferase n=1 Tax=candidate division WWE3 bacterium GW2011_GWB1_42_6 TaxID=1619115 RepID=A0A0G1AX62_UNCKA|nr:MAG: PMT family glycosyltransferase, 4-amino-4-deoxy-L-arabinose transferase [candidate division WWE3 bacterium GW2011_GWB1_42_6]